MVALTGYTTCSPLQYVCMKVLPLKWKENQILIKQKLSECFLVYYCFRILPLGGGRINEQHENEINSRPPDPILIKSVSVPTFSRLGLVNIQFQLSSTTFFQLVSSQLLGWADTQYKHDEHDGKRSLFSFQRTHRVAESASRSLRQQHRSGGELGLGGTQPRRAIYVVGGHRPKSVSAAGHRPGPASHVLEPQALPAHHLDRRQIAPAVACDENREVVCNRIPRQPVWSYAWKFCLFFLRENVLQREATLVW